MSHCTAYACCRHDSVRALAVSPAKFEMKGEKFVPKKKVTDKVVQKKLQVRGAGACAAQLRGPAVRHGRGAPRHAEGGADGWRLLLWGWSGPVLLLALPAEQVPRVWEVWGCGGHK